MLSSYKTNYIQRSYVIYKIKIITKIFTVSFKKPNITIKIEAILKFEKKCSLSWHAD